MLPANKHSEQIISAISLNQITIIVGATGCGKSTQVPKIILQNASRIFNADGLNKSANSNQKGKLITAKIGVTQPRRVAAITLATRVAKELEVELGQEVGYQVRFESKCSNEVTKIKYVTDGMLLRECLLSKVLYQYNVLILDEVHERSVNTDLLLGIVKSIAKIRMENFKVLLMSATIDIESFKRYFETNSVVQISGASYPEGCLISILQICLSSQLEQKFGNILVFLTGQEDIEDLYTMLEQKYQEIQKQNISIKVEICKLFAALPSHIQMKAFAQVNSGFQRIILSTNLAETSVTLPDIEYVIDTGLCKQRYYLKTGFESLQIKPISKASASQRAGRAGRVRPGHCYRIYTQESYFQLEENTQPEITRANLIQLALTLATLDKDPYQFP